MTTFFKRQPEILAVLSHKPDGPMKIGTVDAEVNRNRFFVSHGFTTNNVVSAEIVHGNTVAAVTADDAGKVIPQADALVTQSQNLYLSVTVADCLPIFFYDANTKVIGMAHAGWRGLVAGILGNVIDAMKEEFSTNPADIQVSIGPAIGKCHFETGEEVVQSFSPSFPAAVKKDEELNKWHIDLIAIAKEQLMAKGILSTNIEATMECTYCNSEKYFSFRRDKDAPVKAMVAIMGLH